MDSPLEARAFNYLSFGCLTVVNHVWTLVAVVTAAISFWRIRASSISSKPDRSCVNPVGFAPATIPPNTPSSPPETAPEPASASIPELPLDCLKTTKTTWFGAVLPEEMDRETRGKFTFYYNNDGCINGDSDGEDEDCNSDVDSDGVMMAHNGIYDNYVERVVEMRTAKIGWRRYQNLTVINGNVVRLWEFDGGCRRRTTVL